MDNAEKLFWGCFLNNQRKEKKDMKELITRQKNQFFLDSDYLFCI